VSAHGGTVKNKNKILDNKGGWIYIWLEKEQKTLSDLYRSLKVLLPKNFIERRLK